MTGNNIRRDHKQGGRNAIAGLTYVFIAYGVILAVVGLGVLFAVRVGWIG